jgi:hypothetical protein
MKKKSAAGTSISSLWEKLQRLRWGYHLFFSQKVLSQCKKIIVVFKIIVKFWDYFLLSSILLLDSNIAIVVLK